MTAGPDSAALTPFSHQMLLLPNPQGRKKEERNIKDNEDEQSGKTEEFPSFSFSRSSHFGREGNNCITLLFSSSLILFLSSSMRVCCTFLVVSFFLFRQDEIGNSSC